MGIVSLNSTNRFTENWGLNWLELKFELINVGKTERKTCCCSDNTGKAADLGRFAVSSQLQTTEQEESSEFDSSLGEFDIEQHDISPDVDIEQCDSESFVALIDSILHTEKVPIIKLTDITKIVIVILIFFMCIIKSKKKY